MYLYTLIHWNCDSGHSNIGDSVQGPEVFMTRRFALLFYVNYALSRIKDVEPDYADEFTELPLTDEVLDLLRAEEARLARVLGGMSDAKLEALAGQLVEFFVDNNTDAGYEITKTTLTVAADNGDEPAKLPPADYVEKLGLQCPVCLSEDVNADGPVEMSDAAGYQPCSCSACGSSWSDDLMLAGYSHLHVPTKVDSNG